MAPADATSVLPGGTWRLTISTMTLDPRDAARLVERGGIVAATSADPESLVAQARAAGLRLDQIAQAVTGEWRYLGRRED